MSEKGIDENDFLSFKFSCQSYDCVRGNCDALRNSFNSQCSYSSCPFVYWINVYHEIQKK